jgi:DNA-binding NarL/FixJ family response regulator
MARERPITVVLAEGHRLIRAGVRRVLESDGRLVVVGEAGRGEQAVAAARLLHPDVVLIDAAVPGVEALRAARQIYDAGLDGVQVLLLTESPGEDGLIAALHAGARGVALRDSDPAELRRAVRMVAGGAAVLASGPEAIRRVATSVLPQREDAATHAPRLRALTHREQEVLAFVALGLSNWQIANRLRVSPATIKAHVGSAAAKLGAPDRAHLVRFAYETGLVRPPRPTCRGGTAAGGSGRGQN